MEKPKSTFPLRTLLIVNAIWWLIVILGIRYLIRYCLFREPYIDTTILATIGTIIVAAALVTANTIMVAITKSYADQTTRLANETKRMVDFYHSVEQEKLKPLFLPFGDGYSIQGDQVFFFFINIGKDALYVKIDIPGIATGFRDYHRIESETDFSLGVFKKVDIAHVANIESMVPIQFRYCDKALNQYQQVFKFRWKDTKFIIDESCLPSKVP